jgi:hypothetical protein
VIAISNRRSSAISRTSAAAGWLTPLGVRLAVVSFAVGQDDQTEAAAAALAADADPQVRGRMQLYRVRAASRQGRTGRALDLAAAAVNDQEMPALWATRIRARAAGVLAKEDRDHEARAAAVRALTDATTLADGVAVAYTRLVLAHASAPEEALAHIEHGLTDLGWDAESNDLRLILLNNKLAWLNNLGRRPARAVRRDRTVARPVSTSVVMSSEYPMPAACHALGNRDSAVSSGRTSTASTTAPCGIDAGQRL